MVLLEEVSLGWDLRPNAVLSACGSGCSSLLRLQGHLCCHAPCYDNGLTLENHKEAPSKSHLDHRLSTVTTTAWRPTPLTQALGRQRREDLCEYEAYTVRPCLKKRWKQNNNKTLTKELYLDFCNKAWEVKNLKIFKEKDAYPDLSIIYTTQNISSYNMFNSYVSYIS